MKKYRGEMGYGGRRRSFIGLALHIFSIPGSTSGGKTRG